MGTRPSVLVLGVGNVLWADEGFGVRAIEALQHAYAFPGNVTLLDGGTLGPGLLPYIQAAGVLVVFDAVDCALAPGSLIRLEDGEIPASSGTAAVGLHGSGLPELLALAAALGTSPGHVVLIGVQPAEMENFGGALSPAVRRQLEPAIGMALAALQRAGVGAVERQAAG